MDYNKQKKPGILTKTAVRSKSKKQLHLREAEHRLPSSSHGNKKEFFSGFKEDQVVGVSEMDLILKNVDAPTPLSITIPYSSLEMEVMKKIVQLKRVSWQ